MRTQTTSDQASSQSRAKKKATAGLAGLAITGLLLAACTSAAGAARPQPGQYRQATSTVQSESQTSEREMLRKEHLGSNAAPASNERETLRQEHLAK